MKAVRIFECKPLHPGTYGPLTALLCEDEDGEPFMLDLTELLANAQPVRVGPVSLHVMINDMPFAFAEHADEDPRATLVLNYDDRL